LTLAFSLAYKKVLQKTTDKTALRDKNREIIVEILVVKKAQHVTAELFFNVVMQNYFS
jgi:hypothetical protein